ASGRHRHAGSTSASVLSRREPYPPKDSGLPCPPFEVLVLGHTPPWPFPSNRPASPRPQSGLHYSASVPPAIALPCLGPTPAARPSSHFASVYRFSRCRCR